MSGGREFEGKDLDEAIEQAAAKMGIPAPDLDYEIVEQGRRGVFGLGAKSVRIRVKPPIDDTVDGKARSDGAERGPRPRPRKRREDGSGGPRRPERSRRERRRKARPAAPTDETPVSGGVGGEILETVRRMLGLMGFDVTAEAVSSPSGIKIAIQGPDTKAFTRKDGELLSALQFLLNRMQRRTWPDAGRIQVGCDGHRQRRDDDLIELTREVAQQVCRTGKPKRLQPMNAYERRLVHLTTREFQGVGSRSEGNGAMKSVRIFREKSAEV